MASSFQSYTVPAGQQMQLQFSTGARPPINVLVLIAGGSTDLKIDKVVGMNNGMPTLTFNPPATPFEFTINSVQRPLFNCPSADFIFSVANGGTRDHTINIGSISR